MPRTLFKLLIVAWIAVGFAPADARAQALPDVPDVSWLAIPGGPVPTALPGILGLQGEIHFVVRLVDESLAQAQGKNAKQLGRRMARSQQGNYLDQLAQRQEALLAGVRNLGGRELGRLRKALNAVVVAIDASQAAALQALPGVLSVRPLHDYKRELSTTVPYIGARTVQGAGVTGAGVRVAVLDSGIDYTHKFFGGPGTAAAYLAAYGSSTTDVKNTTTDGLFPTSKVVGGYDFVGEAWPNGPLAPDPDPIDCGPSAIPLPCDGGHGSHVADIIGGDDGASHKGVAPGVSLYAVKVCSAISTACSGLALLQAMEFALDPDGDGDISDAVDVINMSLGSPYGQIQDDLSEAASIASQFGVVVVVAAGNDADRPYIVNSPSISPEAISVAQTHVPTAARQLMTIVLPAAIAGNYSAVFQPWSAPLTAVIEAPVQYGNGVGGNLDGCAAFPAGALTGKIVLVDRGICAFSDKIRNVANGGGLIGVIGLIAPGDPFEGAFGGGAAITIPGFMIGQATATLIKNQLGAGVVARFDPNLKLPLVMSVVGTSARGPSYSFNSIKPEIAAPGASVSAEAGTGTGQTVFGGTSGATPMVAGSAALLVQAFPSASSLEIKARLMNTAETAILTDPVNQPGVLAPITRVGGGEVRVNRAFDTQTAAWDADDLTPSLSFGYGAFNDEQNLTRTVEVHNYSRTTRSFVITATFRYAADRASGAVVVDAPSSITVPAHGSKKFKVKLRLDPSKLPIWTLNGGARGGDGFRLQEFEFDGFIVLADFRDAVRLPWHLLPHRAAKVITHSTRVNLRGGVGHAVVSNIEGAVDGRVDLFALTGENRKIRKNLLPEPGDNFAVIDLRLVGVRLVNTGLGPGVQFAINTQGKRSQPNYPAEFDVLVDSDYDGDFDYAIFNLENGGFAVTGQNVVAIQNLATNTATAFFFTDADLDSSNVILTVPLAALGLTPTDRIDFSLFAFDNYFTGDLTDAIVAMQFTPAVPRFVASGIPPAGVPAGGVSLLTIQEVPDSEEASPSQTGILLMNRDNKNEADSIRMVP